jgi:glycosyltransferase involved in cell wall biosynthesis
MRILVDYRAALRARTGVGEYIHALVRAYTAIFADDVLLFSSSWKDRLRPERARELRATAIDCRIPVRVLNLLWHRAGWPPIEALAGPVDVAHAAHPLLVPARGAAQVVTIHDLFFLEHPERTRAEIRRDYPSLAADHARRAHAVITSTHRTRGLVHDRLGVPAEAIYVCPPGPPRWESLGRGPHIPVDGCILFLGTLEPRKNVGVLLDAYADLLARHPAAPRLVLAGRATPEAAPWLDRLAHAPLKGRALHIGYVPDEQQETLFASARVLVLPSLDEGFGLPALAAMSAGIPVIASTRGSLPEVVGSAGVLIDPHDAGGLAQALARVTTDTAFAADRAVAGLERARAFSWERAAGTLHQAYRDAIVRRRSRRPGVD